jgi:hypothetical protein
MPRPGIARPILLATAVAGTLDILSAFVFAGMAGVSVIDGAAPTPGWAAIGLLVHYAIMACMAAAYMIAAPRLPALLRHPILAGLLYGLLLWGIMYWIVKPLRWPDAPLPHNFQGIAAALFAHCILVGLPIAWIASRHFRRRSAFA